MNIMNPSPIIFGFFQFVSILCCAVLLAFTTVTESKIPRKYNKNLADKSLYCDVCSNVMIDVQEYLHENVLSLSDSYSSYKIDKNGKRQQKSFMFEYEDDDVYNGLTTICGGWGQSLGTSQSADGRMRMLKQSHLSGSFSGSINFGGEGTKKVVEMCRTFIRKQKKNIAQALQITNELNIKQMSKFCQTYVSSKTCHRIKYPKEVKKTIKELEGKLKARGQMYNGEEDEDLDEIELSEDDVRTEL